MTAEELLERYATGERDFKGVDLSGVDLKDAELRGINLSQANLSGTDLSGADLSGYGFQQNTHPISSDLTDSVLINANLSWANLKFVDFSRSDLSGVDSTFSECGGTIFDDSIMIGVNFTGIKGSFSVDGADTGYDMES